MHLSRKHQSFQLESIYMEAKFDTRSPAFQIFTSGANTTTSDFRAEHLFLRGYSGACQRCPSHFGTPTSCPKLSREEQKSNNILTQLECAQLWQCTPSACSKLAAQTTPMTSSTACLQFSWMTIPAKANCCRKCFELSFINVQRQCSSSDCALFAITNSTALCLHQDLHLIQYD